MKKYIRIPTSVWLSRLVPKGHISVGRFTFYGLNAMHIAVDFYTKRWGYLCFHPPVICFGQFWPWYFYASPNATPWASTFMLGKAHGLREKYLSRIRRKAFGHNYSLDENYESLKKINGLA